MRISHRNAAIAAIIALGCLAAFTALVAAAGVVRWQYDRRAQPLPSFRADDHPKTGVVTFAGVADIHFGDSATELTTEHGLHPEVGGCALHFTDVTGVDPVFADGRLVLMWVHAPVHTPEGIMEGSSVASVRQAYAGEIELAPPAGSHAFPGILVLRDDKAYLFLHDGRTVRKEIAGYADYVQRLYESGFGTC